MYKRRVSRRFYALICNRVFADLLLLIDVAFDVDLISVLLFYASFYATGVTYVSLLVVKLCGIARPLQMRNGIRLRTCILIIVLRYFGQGNGKPHNLSVILLCLKPVISLREIELG